MIIVSVLSINYCSVGKSVLQQTGIGLFLLVQFKNSLFLLAYWSVVSGRYIRPDWLRNIPYETSSIDCSAWKNDCNITKIIQIEKLSYPNALRKLQPQPCDTAQKKTTEKTKKTTQKTSHLKTATLKTQTCQQIMMKKFLKKKQRSLFLLTRDTSHTPTKKSKTFSSKSYRNLTASTEVLLSSRWQLSGKVSRSFDHYTYSTSMIIMISRSPTYSSTNSASSTPLSKSISSHCTCTDTSLPKKFSKSHNATSRKVTLAAGMLIFRSSCTTYHKKCPKIKPTVSALSLYALTFLFSTNFLTFTFCYLALPCWNIDCRVS